MGVEEAGVVGVVGVLGGRQRRHLQSFVPSPGTCGHRIMRIGGRVPSPERKWPWQVSVQVNSVHKLSQGTGFSSLLLLSQISLFSAS